jgi:predicted Ser/Thr protein kinase
MDRIGRYEIVRELGRGAMGVVYHAIDPNIGRPVAIKTIQLGGKTQDRERLRERLFREARSAGILSHPGIVTIYDVEHEGDMAYIAMEFVDGTNLDHLMEPGQAMTPDRMFDILGQTAAALDYAHGKGIVHRDIKPANIMVTRDGVVKIADFGIAKVTASEQFTMTGAIVGTPHYMSPEQVQGQAVDGRSDQFSLAVVAFELLTGDKPYTGEHITTVVYKIVAEEPAPAQRLNPKLTAPIEASLRHALAKKPDARYGSCREFVNSLEQACRAVQGWAPVPRGGAMEEATTEAVRPDLPPPLRPRLDPAAASPEIRGRRKFGFPAFLLVTVLAAAVLAFIGWRADPRLSQQILSRVGLSQAPPAAGAQAQDAQDAPRDSAGESKPSPMPHAQPAEMPATPAEAASASEPDKTSSPADAGRSPFTQPAQTKTAPGPARAGLQGVLVVSSPAGATASLDARPDVTCTTPCTLPASPGRHDVVVSMPGYEVEHRDVQMGSSLMELPPVVLRAPSGTLMLTTAPDGATVSVDGKRIPQTTPAQIALSPGNYKVTVEKDGKQATSPVEIRNGAISYLRITLN